MFLQGGWCVVKKRSTGMKTGRRTSPSSTHRQDIVSQEDKVDSAIISVWRIEPQEALYTHLCPIDAPLAGQSLALRDIICFKPAIAHLLVLAHSRVKFWFFVFSVLAPSVAASYTLTRRRWIISGGWMKAIRRSRAAALDKGTRSSVLVW